jgi:hypothetical protein
VDERDVEKGRKATPRERFKGGEKGSTRREI